MSADSKEDAKGEAPRDTLVSPSLGSLVGPSESGATGSDFQQRYEVGESIGEGGMGEVRLTRDQRIGREIAMKLLRAQYSGSPEAAIRFAREARVQGQLEHPSVVPVYDLGVAPDGQTFFTMKRIHGRTLRDILHEVRHDEAGGEQYSTRKLLHAFTQVCLAIDFAHSRGVIHRDLKPENLMLGDFGEVYVLDWGTARVGGVESQPTAMLGIRLPTTARKFGDRRAHQRVEAGPRRSRDTIDGELFGTPGYMPPEQAIGAHSTLDERADVYALGAVLFEILALEPLHAGNTVEELVSSTVAGVDARPSLRKGGMSVPPELDAVCVRACALGVSVRFRSARELGAAVGAYLDGDRDLERRTAIVDEQAAEAHAAAERALSPTGTHEDRATAMRCAGRALALDSAHASATRTMLRLLTTPPRDVPAEVEADLESAVSESLRQFASFAAFAYLAALAVAPFVIALGVREWWSLVAVDTCVALAAAVCFVGRRSSRFAPIALLIAFTLGTLAAVGLSRLWGSFIVGPTCLVLHTSLYAMLPGRGRRLAIVSAGALAIFVPDLAQMAGLVSQQTILDGSIRVIPAMVNLPPVATRWMVLVSSALLVVCAGAALGRLRDAVRGAEGRLRLQTWHLKHLAPRG